MEFRSPIISVTNRRTVICTGVRASKEKERRACGGGGVADEVAEDEVVEAGK